MEWSKPIRLATTGSTNADLAKLAKEGALPGTIIAADHQSSGRGRFERVWEAPPGKSLAVSVLLKPSTKALTSWLPLVVGLGICEGLQRLGAPAVLKWPNDILVDDGKICGILVERVETKSGFACIAGFGINTSLSATELPVPTATSLALHGINFSNDEILDTVLSALESRYRKWDSGESIKSEYLKRCATIGKEVKVQLSETENIFGKAVGISDSGCLLVEVAGKITEFSAGDVFHLRRV